MITVEAVKSALDFSAFYQSELGELKPGTNGNHLALCPFHEDSDPSLSVNLQTGLYLCFGCQAKGNVFDFYRAKHGCDFREALEELARRAGLDVEVARSKEQPGRIVATYDYFDPSGKLAFQVCRMDPKSFRQRRPDGKGGWIWNMTGVDRMPYRLPQVLKADSVFVVEGEKDVATLECLGLTATCNPGGAGKWRRDYAQHFQGKKVVILPDNDAPGRAHAQDVAMNLHGVAASVKVIELPDLPDKGDVSDWIERGKEIPIASMRRALLVMVERAPEWQPQAQHKDEAQSAKPGVPTIQFVTGRELQSIEFKEPEWIVPGMLPEGLCLLSARPKKGKTWLAMGVSVARSTGGCALGKGELRIDQGKVPYLALEDKLRRAKKRLEKILGGAPFPEELIIAESWPRLDKGGLEALQDFLKEHDDCKLVVIDSFVKIKPPRPKNVDSYDYDMAVGGALQSLAQQHQICLLIIYHNRKAESDDPLDDVIGSTGLTGAVDAVLVLRRGRGQADGTLFITGRDVEEQELSLKFHPGEGLWELLGDAGEYAKTRERQEIIKFIRENGPKTPKEIAEALGKNPKNIKALFWKMANDGEVKSVEGKYELINK